MDLQCKKCTNRIFIENHRKKRRKTLTGGTFFNIIGVMFSQQKEYFEGGGFRYEDDIPAKKEA